MAEHVLAGTPDNGQHTRGAVTAPELAPPSKAQGEKRIYEAHSPVNRQMLNTGGFAQSYATAKIPSIEGSVCEPPDDEATPRW